MNIRNLSINSRLPMAQLRKMDVEDINKSDKSGTVQQNGGETQVLDPATGKLIIVSEFNDKYNDGNRLLQVKTEDGTYETMTAKEYSQRYGKSANPPKAVLTNRSKIENDSGLGDSAYGIIGDINTDSISLNNGGKITGLIQKDMLPGE